MPPLITSMSVRRSKAYRAVKSTPKTYISVNKYFTQRVGVTLKQLILIEKCNTFFKYLSAVQILHVLISSQEDSCFYKPVQELTRTV